MEGRERNKIPLVLEEEFEWDLVYNFDHHDYDELFFCYNCGKIQTEWEFHHGICEC